MLVADPGLRDPVDGEVEDASAGARAELAREVKGPQHANGANGLVIAERDRGLVTIEAEEPQRVKVARLVRMVSGLSLLRRRKVSPSRRVAAWTVGVCSTVTMKPLVMVFLGSE